jgi:hypothetical protein
LIREGLATIKKIKLVMAILTTFCLEKGQFSFSITLFISALGILGYTYLNNQYHWPAWLLFKQEQAFALWLRKACKLHL